MKRVKYCPICGSELKFEGFCEEDGHYHYYCVNCDNECSEHTASDSSILDVNMEDMVFED